MNIFIVGKFVSPQENARTPSLEAAREKSGTAQLRRQEVGYYKDHLEKDARNLCRERIPGIIQGMTKLQGKALVFLSSGD